MSENLVTADRLRELLHYDPETGVFTRRVTRQRYRAGQIVGGLGGGYRNIKINNHFYRAHRLAWLYMTGEWPAGDLDHINMNKTDNRWCNLREADGSANNANKGLRVDNISGFKGVYWYKREHKWRAQIGVSGKIVHLGRFDNPQEAALAYATAACGVFGAFARPKWRDLLRDIRGA